MRVRYAVLLIRFPAWTASVVRRVTPDGAVADSRRGVEMQANPL